MSGEIRPSQCLGIKMPTFDFRWLAFKHPFRIMSPLNQRKRMGDNMQKVEKVEKEAQKESSLAVDVARYVDAVLQGARLATPY